MPSLVQVAAPASQGAPMLTGNQSSASASSTGEGRERAFSNHLKAQQHGNQNKASDHASKESESAGKPATASAEADSSIADEGRDHVASKAADAGANARKDSSEAGSQASDERDVLVNSGLQNAPAKGLEDQIIEAPLATMGEQVLALLAADDAASFDSAATSDSPVNSLAMAAGGNESPPKDGLLPQQAVEHLIEPLTEESVATARAIFELEGAKLELPVVDGEVLTATAQQIAAGVSPAQVAAALRQGEQVSSTPVSPAQTGELLARPNPALLNATPELLRTAPGKQSLVLSEMLDNEVDADLELGLNPGKAVKASLLEGSTPKLPATTQVVTEALSNGSGPKDNFEQVRQNIMAALAGKSEIPNPVNLAVSGGGHEASEAPGQGLNFSSLSSTLAATGAESTKYTATQESTPPRFFTLQTPAGQPGWDVEVGNRIRWMVGQNNSGVQLRLNPPELGSIEVKVATEGERTSVTFFAANPAARDALELALPRLREMFADSGMQLANADVSDQGFQQEREHLSGGSEGLSAGGDTGEAMILEAGPGLVSEGQAEGRGVIDYYI
ncbi:MAG: hypothetical protein DRQ64_01270 [Gammaproteobacteria bacterium]|nr:MAG: hypothetical protein DRQ64_01270 [Gammaproteobacteria bacterium]